MNPPEDQIPAQPRNQPTNAPPPRSASWLLGVALALFLIAFAAQLLTDPDPGILCFEFTFGSTEAASILKAWSNSGQSQARLNLKLDFLFIPAYTLLLLLLLRRYWCCLGVRNPTAIYLLVLAPILAGVLDCAENVMLLDVLSRPSSIPTALPIAASVAALLKFALLGIVILFIAAGLFRRRRMTTESTPDDTGEIFQ